MRFDSSDGQAAISIQTSHYHAQLIRMDDMIRDSSVANKQTATVRRSVFYHCSCLSLVIEQLKPHPGLRSMTLIVVKQRFTVTIEQLKCTKATGTGENRWRKGIERSSKGTAMASAAAPQLRSQSQPSSSP